MMGEATGIDATCGGVGVRRLTPPLVGGARGLGESPFAGVASPLLV